MILKSKLLPLAFFTFFDCTLGNLNSSATESNASRRLVPLEQYTPDKSDWSTFYEKAVLNNPGNEDHSPDGVGWIALDDWQPWDGTVYNPADYSRMDFAHLICPGNTIRGMYELFYDTNPFYDNENPTKAEVDNWHAISLNHVRAMVGYTEEEYTIRPDKCLHIRALWSEERMTTRMWDDDYPDGTCEGTSNPHCGAGFIPSVEDQQEYLPEGISSCGNRAGSEGIFNAAKSNIPWSIKWIRPFCQTLGAEGFWGGHTGPWFHRSQFGWSWDDSDPDNFHSNAGLRAKWSGPSGARKYEDPDITDGKFLVIVEGEDPNPRFPGFECAGIQWSDGADSATACYERMMNEDNCGKRFMTFNSLNFGCACYLPALTICSVSQQPGRLTWDFEPVVSSFDGLFIDPDKALSGGSLPYDGRRCPNINWKLKAGSAIHCLQKIIEGNFEDCGRKFITWNSANGGCACYPPSQETCERNESIRESGRQTYELEVDPSYGPPPPAPTTPAPATPDPVTPSVTPAPVTPSPVSPAPVTPAPVTLAPVSSSPVTPSPVTPSPVTPSPVTPAPVTPTLAPVAPTSAPVAPTSAPVAPTSAPVEPTSPPVAPTSIIAPTDAPTDAPVVAPTDAPAVAPTDAPVVAPTNAPVVAPTDAPIVDPTNAPTSTQNYVLSEEDTKCPHRNNKRLFRTPDRNPLTIEQCYQLCYDTEDCKQFSWGTNSLKQRHQGVCMGCTSDAVLSSHTGFNGYEILVSRENFPTASPTVDNGFWDPVGQNLKCPNRNSQRLFRTRDNSPLTLEQCHQRCYETPGCKYFSLGMDTNSLPTKHHGVCMGCKENAVLLTHRGFNAFEMTILQNFPTPSPTSGSDLYDPVASNKKCPNDNRRLFRTENNQPLTRDQCYEKCKNTDRCEYFTYAEGENLREKWKGLCIGCEAGSLQTHSGFNTYVINLSQNRSK